MVALLGVQSFSFALPTIRDPTPIQSEADTVSPTPQRNHEPSNPKPVAMDADLEAGRLLYDKRCAHCHGAEGRGDGPVAPFLDPKPRDFTSAQFKIRSTPGGRLPTDQDLFNAITNGLPGTAMEGWAILTEKERWQSVQYVKTFAQKFSQEKPQPIDLDKNVSLGSKAPARGKELYREMKCFLCHGEDGKGDGAITVTMRSVWGMAFDARNLTRGDQFKGGGSVEDIYRTISTGLAGTPMDAYADYMSSEERWYLAAYVNSLSLQPKEPSEVVLTAHHTSGDLPADPDDGRWEEAKEFAIPLSGQVIAKPRLMNPGIDLIIVKSFYNESEIAFLLQWDDRTRAQEAVFQDAIAVQFPTKIPEGPVKPHFFMGQPGKSVNILKWEAGRDSLATEFVATGFESVKAQPDTGQHVKARAIWKNGRWKVVLRRPLRTLEHGLDIQFEKGKLIPIAFSAWDGANKEIDLRKSLSSWYYVVLETSKPTQVYLYALLGILAAINLQLWLIRKVRRAPAIAESVATRPAAGTTEGDLS